MATPCIITVAITGSVPTKANNPAVPITIAEQIEATQEAFEAGAILAHCPQGRQHADLRPRTVRPASGRTAKVSPRHDHPALDRRPLGRRTGARHAGVAPGHGIARHWFGRFPTRVYENAPDLVDWLAQDMLTFDVRIEMESFDPVMIFKAVEMTEAARVAGPLHVQFVMGVKSAMPADPRTFEFYIATVRRLAPDATWTGAGIGKDQITLNRWSLELGGHCRTGLEDDVRLDHETLAPFNGAMARRVVDLCAEYDRRPATAAEARALLSLPAAA